MFRRIELETDQPDSATFVVHACKAHPHWKDYVILVVDLTTPFLPAGEPYLHKEGMTHEMHLFAVNPRTVQLDHESVGKDIEIEDDMMDQIPQMVMSPDNHAYQFPAKDSAEAFHRIEDIARRIEDEEISPDTDFSKQWDSQLFSDGVSLKNQPKLWTPETDAGYKCEHPGCREYGGRVGLDHVHRARRFA